MHAVVVPWLHCGGLRCSKFRRCLHDSIPCPCPCPCFTQRTTAFPPPLPWPLQTLLRLLLSILRGPLSADEAAAAAGGEDGGAGGSGSSMEGVQQQPGGLRPLAEGPVIDLGELLLGCQAAELPEPPGWTAGLLGCCFQPARLAQLHYCCSHSHTCSTARLPVAGLAPAHEGPTVPQLVSKRVLELLGYLCSWAAFTASAGVAVLVCPWHNKRDSTDARSFLLLCFTPPLTAVVYPAGTIARSPRRWCCCGRQSLPAWRARWRPVVTRRVRAGEQWRRQQSQQALCLPALSFALACQPSLACLLALSLSCSPCVVLLQARGN